MRRYSIKNIKAFKNEAEINIKPITIFVGKNSCGKSSLIRFPVVISQTMLSDADSPVSFFGKNIDYGNFEDVVFGHGKKSTISFSLSYDCFPGRYYYSIPKESIYASMSAKSQKIDICVGVARYSKRMIVNSCSINIADKSAIEITRVQNEKYHIKFIDCLNESKQIEFDAKRLRFTKFIPWFDVESMYDQIVEAYLEIKTNSKIDSTKFKELKKEIIGHSYGINSELDLTDDENEILELKNICQMIDYYSSLMMNLRMQAMQDASDTYYIGPFRENPSRVYRDVEHQVDSVGVRGEDVSAMLKNDYTHGKKILSGVSNWFEKSMHYKVNLKDIGSGLYNVVVQKDDGTQDNLIDVGYGISQVLPIVTQLMRIKLFQPRRFYGPVNRKNRSTFIIEQPELHLHPGAQAELANLFVDVVAQKNEQPIDVVIETHSEHLIRRLQALVADKNVNITNQDIKIYYVDKNDNNEAYIQEMKLSETGQFENEWPSGFFDKAHELSMELIRNNFK